MVPGPPLAKTRKREQGAKRPTETAARKEPSPVLRTPCGSAPYYPLSNGCSAVPQLLRYLEHLAPWRESLGRSSVLRAPPPPRKRPHPTNGLAVYFAFPFYPCFRFGSGSVGAAPQSTAGVFFRHGSLL